MFSWPLTRQRNAWISDWIVSSTRKRIYCKSEKKRYVYTESVSCNCCFTRLYLINSPVVRAETLKFQEKGVKDIIKDVFLPWYNAHRFLLQNIQQMERVSQHLYFSVFLKLRACDLNFFCRRAAQHFCCTKRKSRLLPAAGNSGAMNSGHATRWKNMRRNVTIAFLSPLVAKL